LLASGTLGFSGTVDTLPAALDFLLGLAGNLALGGLDAAL